MDFQTLEIFLNAFAKGLAKLLPKTLCDGVINKGMNKWIHKFKYIKSNVHICTFDFIW